jgi:hypothetical protein
VVTKEARALTRAAEGGDRRCRVRINNPPHPLAGYHQIATPATLDKRPPVRYGGVGDNMPTEGTAVAATFSSPWGKLKLPSVLQTPGVKSNRLVWFYKWLARKADADGFCELSLHEASSAWNVSRQLMQYWLRRLTNMRLVKVLDEGGGRGRKKILRIRRFAVDPAEFNALRKGQNKGSKSILLLRRRMTCARGATGLLMFT